MKKTILSLSLLALAPLSNAAVVTLGLHPDCNGNGTPAGYQGADLLCELPLSIAPNNNMDTVVLGTESDVTFDPIIWTLPGIVVVGKGNAQDANPDNPLLDLYPTELRIDPGARVAGAVNSESALIISRGSKIDAQGTASNPVIFSSLDSGFSGAGEWGGLVLSGFGESNNCPSGQEGGGSNDGCEMEGVAPGYHYGSGHLPAPRQMSSGTLSHVVIAEGGHEVAVDSEINGLTLYAVSQGTSSNPTVINNIHVHENKDDGVEFFGGDAAITNMWMTCNQDDSVDWDEGYKGFLFNVSIKQGDNAGYALELANNPDDDDAMPRAKGTIFSMSIDYIGTSGTPASVPFKMKEGTDGVFNNVVLGDAYDSLSCDETAGAYDMANPWGTIEYDCTPVNGDPAAWDLPGSTDNPGFTAPSFWAFPACTN